MWDIHHHWVNEEGYIDGLLREMDRLGVERVCLIAMGDVLRNGPAKHQSAICAYDNNDLARMVRQHPDRLIGMGFVHLGHDSPEVVDRLAGMGMSGLKFHIPAKPYGEPEYFPFYERAAAHRLPCLFHTGVIYVRWPAPGLGIRSENYRPIHLEPIAYEFRDLPLIAAHLGVCWNEEAAMLARICPNIYVEISGGLNGWRSSRPLEWFKQIFYWPGASSKVLFGSDAHFKELEQQIADQRRIFTGIGWSESQLADVFHNNARRLFS